MAKQAPRNNGKYFKDRPNTYVLFKPAVVKRFPVHCLAEENIAARGSHDYCFEKLQKAQSHSFDFALKMGGWTLVHADDVEALRK